MRLHINNKSLQDVSQISERPHSKIKSIIDHNSTEIFCEVKPFKDKTN